MGKKDNLEKIHQTASNMCYENKAILESLISYAKDCQPNCCTLLEIVKKKNEKAFKKIERSREILNFLD